MPPPSYIDITSIPFSRVVTVAEFNGGTYGGVPNEVWFRYVATDGVVLGVRGNVERAVNMATQIYAADGSTLLNSTTNNRPLGYEVGAASTTYVRIADGMIAANFTAEFDTRPLLTELPDGAFFVNDFNFGAPACVFDLDGDVLGYIHGFPAGEFGAMLDDGYILLMPSISDAVILDASFATVTTVPDIGGSAAIARGNNKWWAVASDGSVYTVSKTGVAIWLATLPAQPASFGVSNDETILYYVDADSPIVKQWDLVNDVALSDLYTEPGFDNAGDGDTMGVSVNFTSNGELLVLGDDSLVTWWLDWINGATNFLHLSAGGSLLNRLTITGFMVDHPQLASEGDNYIMVWMQDPTQVVAKFGVLDLTTGVFTDVFTTAEFGAMRNGNPSDPLYNQIMFGPETSCIMLRQGVTAAPVDESPGVAITCLHGSSTPTIRLMGSYASLLGARGSCSPSIALSGSV